VYASSVYFTLVRQRGFVRKRVGQDRSVGQTSKPFPSSLPSIQTDGLWKEHQTARILQRGNLNPWRHVGVYVCASQLLYRSRGRASSLAMIKAVCGIYIRMRTAVRSPSFVKYFLICTKTRENIYETTTRTTRSCTLYFVQNASFAKERCEKSLWEESPVTYTDLLIQFRALYRMLIKSIKNLRSYYLMIFNS